MRQDEIDEIRSCILTDKTKFHYFKDRYALMLLAWVAKDGVAVGNVKRSRFGRLMQKRIPREVASRTPNGLLTRTSLESFWPQQRLDSGAKREHGVATGSRPPARG